MKWIYVVLCMGLVQLTFCSFNPEEFSTQETLWKCYENELNSMARNFSVKAEIISKTLLETKIVYKVSSIIVKRFETFLKDFLRDYKYFKQFKIYQPVISIFENVTYSAYYQHDQAERKEEDFKFKQLMKQYFGEIFAEYEADLKKFIQEKFLILYEQNKMNLNPMETLQHVESLKKCLAYKCFHSNFQLFWEAINPSKALLVEQFVQDFEQVTILVIVRNINIFKSILKDNKFSELSPKTEEFFTSFIQKFTESFELKNNILSFILQDDQLIFHYFMMAFSTTEDFDLLANLNEKHTKEILSSKFSKESRYYIYRILRKFAFSQILNEQDIPEDKQPLLTFVKQELYAARREDNTYYG
ncbi:uncharacterized protein ACRADG_005540 [Cochliomyia hominivorax]